MSIILHIPHSSEYIPSEYLPFFQLTKNELKNEILKMTDHFTDELFSLENTKIKKLQFPVSRLLVDPERFENDEKEPMNKVGMGCIYTHTHDLKPLKKTDDIREKLVKKYYKPHHKKFNNLVSEILKKESKVLIIDCHSFPRNPLPYELIQKKERAEICIGTDKFHTPVWLEEKLVKEFRKFNFTVSINEPFSGSIVPMAFFNKNKKVQSVMIEIRRDLYMNEKKGKKSRNFYKIKSIIGTILKKMM